jgi:two-component system response regulator FixJ
MDNKDLAGSPATWKEAQRRIKKLTARQREVLGLVAAGLSNKEIAIELGCSPRTIEIHRGAVMLKLRARSTAHAVRIAVYAAIAEDHAGGTD